MLYGEAKQFDKALEYAQAEIRESRDEDDIRQRLALVLVDGERYDQAEKLLDGWLEKAGEPEAIRFRVLKLHDLVLVSIQMHELDLKNRNSVHEVRE